MNIEDIIKYPRTRHVKGSRFQADDHDLEAIPWKDVSGRHIVVEEKLDGANVGISFSSDGELLLQSRGHFLRGGPREKQFEVFKQWASVHRSTLDAILGTNYIMYGEWLAAKHTMFYDALPSYFMEFDVFDKERQEFLDTPKRKALGNELRLGMRLHHVPVLFAGQVFDVNALRTMITSSLYQTKHVFDRLNDAAENAGLSPESVRMHTDMSELAEGLYIKVEECGRVVERCKFVRESFTNSILEQKEHCHDRPIVYNQLKGGDAGMNSMFEVF